MMIEQYKEPIEILEKINLCHSKHPQKEEPNKLAYAKAGREELSALCGIIRQFKPRKIVEVGVAAGGTSSVIMNAVNKLQYAADLYCVDVAEQCFWDKHLDVGFVLDMAQSMGNEYCNVHLYKNATLAQVIDLIGSDIDLIILDTNHVVPGEMLDYMIAFPYLKDQAFVIVDDLYTPLIHQLPPYHNKNAGDQIAPRLLYSSMSGIKIEFVHESEKPFQYGIKRVDKSDREQILRISEMLLLPWHKNNSLNRINVAKEFIERSYNDQIIGNFTSALELNKKILREDNQQNPMTLWFTGLSGAGKTTLANAVEKRLRSKGLQTIILDGDIVRNGLNNNLGFSQEDRKENIRRIAEVSKLMNDAGLIVLSACISPYVEDRKMARDIIGGRMIEIYVNTPLAVCEKRDVKGLYQKARNGEISNFTGVSAPYEAPENPELIIDTQEINVEQCVDQICGFIYDRI